MSKQELFLNCYDKRYGIRYEISYMRQGKSRLLKNFILKQGFDLKEKSICDIGCGAGSFLRRCPKSAQLLGFELSETNVRSLNQLLKKLGFKNSSVLSIEEDSDTAALIPPSSQDLIVVSHVLEHLEDPVTFLKKHRSCLKEDGVIAGLLPINETRPNPQHLWKVDTALFKEWCLEAGYTVVSQKETDAVGYILYPVNAAKSKTGRMFAGMLRLLIGLEYRLYPQALWDFKQDLLIKYGKAKASQLAFIIRPI